MQKPKDQKVFCEQCKFCSCDSTYCLVGLFGDEIKTEENWICKAPETVKIKTHEIYLYRCQELLYAECRKINAKNDCQFFVPREKYKQKSFFSKILSKFKK